MYFQHEKLHERAMTTAKEYLKHEAELIGIFQELDERRTFERYGMPSLFAYATKVLKLSESTTTALTSIARAARKVPELKEAIEEKKITLSNARRIAPVLKVENKTEWLEKAASLPLNRLERELAKSFPERPAPTRILPKSEMLGRLEVDLSNASLAKLKRAQEILSQKRKTNVDAAAVLESLLDEFIERHDPLEKAKRHEDRSKMPTALVRKPVARLVGKTDTVKNIQTSGQVRLPILAKAKHDVMLRDQARCTYVHANGSRCENTRWLDIHHVKLVSAGGSNSVENLRTLCSAHHRILHRFEVHPKVEW
jgi:hypothetical protein